MNFRRHGRRRWRWLGAGLFLILSLVLAAAWFRSGIEAALVLTDMAAGPHDSLYKHLTESPRRYALHYAMDGRGYDAELYHPAGAVRAGIVLVPGVQPAGKDEPRLVAMATTLARAGFAVLVPDIPGMRQLMVHASDVQGIADGCRWLLAHPGMVPDGRLGIGAVSYAVGPAMLAAMQLDIRSRVRFVLGVGGYYDLAGLLTYFTTGDYRADGQWRHMRPNRYGMWVFALSNLAQLDDARDRQLFTEMARRKLADPGADVDDLAASLGDDGKALYALLTNTERQRVPALIAALPSSMRRLIDALTVAGKAMDQLQAHLILVHGRTDNIIPYTQSEALARAVPSGQAQLFLLDGFGHANLQGLSLKDRFRLWQAVDALLAERQ